TLKLRVRKALDKKPLVGATVTIMASRSTPAPQTSLVTNDDGRVEFEYSSGRDLRVFVAPTSETSLFRCLIHALDPDESRVVELEVPSGEDLRFVGRVVARADQVPIAGATIRVQYEVPASSRSAEIHTLASTQLVPVRDLTSDENGQFTV